MTTKTIAEMLAELPTDRPDNAPMHDILRLEAEVALLRAAGDRLYKVCAGSSTYDEYRVAMADMKKVLEVTK
jgi:hypothetical protein